MNEQQPKILVMRLSSLGDIVLSSAVYKNLKAKWPKSHITLLVKPQFAQVLAGHPDIDEIMVAKKGLFANIAQVRAGNFTHLLDLHSTFKTMVIGLFSKIPNRLRYDKNPIARRMFVAFRKNSPVLEKHTLEKYLDVLSAWDVPIRYKRPELGDWAYKNTELDGKKIHKIGIFQNLIQNPYKLCFIHILKRFDIGSLLDLLFMQIIVNRHHLCRRIALRITILVDDLCDFFVE